MVRTRLATALSSIQVCLDAQGVRAGDGERRRCRAAVRRRCRAVGGGFGLAGTDDLADKAQQEVGFDDAADVAGFGVLGGGDDVNAERAAEERMEERRSTMPGRRAISAQFVDGRERGADLALDAAAQFSLDAVTAAAASWSRTATWLTWGRAASDARSLFFSCRRGPWRSSSRRC